MINQNEFENLSLRVRRGALAQGFLEGPLWNEFLIPRLDKRRKEHLAITSAPENRDSLEKLALNTLFQSGMLKEWEHLEIDLKNWISDAEVASKRLDSLMKKEK